jgi:hypothetical protein
MSVRPRQPDVKFPPAYCPTHGIFPAVGSIGMGQGTTASISHCTVTCPKCGGEARILDGTYTAFADRLQLILDPALPEEARRALLALVEKVKDRTLDLEQAKSEAEKISPKAARLFDIAEWSDGAKAALFGSVLMAGATLAPTLAPMPEKPSVVINQNFNLVGPKEQLRPKFKSSSSLTPTVALPERNPLRRQ